MAEKSKTVEERLDSLEKRADNFEGAFRCLLMGLRLATKNRKTAEEKRMERACWKRATEYMEGRV